MQPLSTMLRLVTLFGRMQQMYRDVIRYGNGIAQEVSWMILQPLFARSNKMNDHTEAMVHIVNFLAMCGHLLQESSSDRIVQSV